MISLIKILVAMIPAIGFAMLFHVPRHALRYCAVLAAIGYGCRLALIQLGISTVAATFFAATIIGFIGVKLGQHYRAHPKVFTVSAIIPMIPGVYAYRAMLSLLAIQKHGYSEKQFAVMIDNFIQSGFIIFALVLGLALPGLLFYRDKPVV